MYKDRFSMYYIHTIYWSYLKKKKEQAYIFNMFHIRQSLSRMAYLGSHTSYLQGFPSVYKAALLSLGNTCFSNTELL